MNHIANDVRLSQEKLKICRRLSIAAALATWGSFIGCTTVEEQPAKPEPVQAQRQPQLGYLQRSKALFAEGKYEAALQENQRALAEGRGAPDAALFNIGLICAYSQNPKRDHPKALQSFRTLVSQHPQSPFAEQGKAWIQVLEEHQKIADERHRLSEEKRAVNKEREALAQEREKLKYTVEKSRQVDMEIERRRRKSLNR